MALTTCSVTTSVIAALDDLPNDVGGLTAAQLKAKFDEFGTNFVAWFNATHIGTDKIHIGNNPAARVYHDAAQSIANSTAATLAFNGERYDTDSIHDNSTNNSRLTCKTAGKYSIKINISWESNASGYRIVQLQHSSGAVIGMSCVAAANGNITSQNVCVDYDLAVNEYVVAVVYQTSGVALNVNSTANYSPEFSMVRVG